MLSGRRQDATCVVLQSEATVASGGGGGGLESPMIWPIICVAGSHYYDCMRPIEIFETDIVGDACTSGARQFVAAAADDAERATRRRPRTSRAAAPTASLPTCLLHTGDADAEQIWPICSPSSLESKQVRAARQSRPLGSVRIGFCRSDWGRGTRDAGCDVMYGA